MDEPVDPNAMGWTPLGPPSPAWSPRHPPTSPLVAPPASPSSASPSSVSLSSVSLSSVSRSRLLGAGLALGVLVTALVVVVAVLVRDKPTAHTRPLSMPSTLGAYHQLTGAEADQVAQAIQSGGGSAGVSQAFFANTMVGVYAQTGSDQPQLVVIAGRTDSIPGIQSDDPDEAAQLLLQGSVLAPQRFPAGALGGAVECGLADASAGPESLCSWYDEKTVGLVLSFNPLLPLPDLDSLNGSLRSDLDH
jgi:hypothetical protein